MKRLVLALVLTVVSMSAFSQGKFESVLFKGVYESDAERFGLGVEGRYLVNDKIRLAPDLTLFLPKDSRTGLDLNLNVHYVFNLSDTKLSLYPLAGIAMINNKVSIKGYSDSFTNWGFNLGGGLSYNLSSKDYINFEIKHIFGDWEDTYFSLGYGVRF